jgi:hypothetical protein
MSQVRCVQVASTTLFKPRLRPMLGRMMAATPAGAFAVDMALGFAVAFAVPLAVSACWEVRARVGLPLTVPCPAGDQRAALPMPTGDSV